MSDRNPTSNGVTDFLRKWMGDGRLQTYEDRERFRKDAGELLRLTPDETTAKQSIAEHLSATWDRITESRGETEARQITDKQLSPDRKSCVCPSCGVRLQMPAQCECRTTNGVHVVGCHAQKSNGDVCACEKPEPALMDHGMASLCEKCYRPIGSQK